MRRHPPEECLRPNHSLKIWGAIAVVGGGRPTILLVAKARILVVDDDPTVVEVLTRYLDREGFEVRSAADGNAALEAATQDPPDLIVLDLMLPGMHGLDVFRRIRLMGRVPVIMLTALGEEEDRVGGLEVGADDYVTKPFSPREVTARIKSVLNRSAADGAPCLTTGPTLRAGELAVDVGARRVTLAGRQIVLTPREQDLLVLLMRNPGVVFRRQELFEAVWGWTYGDSATITVHIRRLREKLEPDPSNPVRILTVWGVGYQFAA